MGWIGIIGASFFVSVEESLVVAAAVCMKAGLTLGAIWLAYPQLKVGPKWFYGLVAVGCGIVLISAKAVLIVGPILLAAWLFSARLHGRGQGAAAEKRS